MEGLPKQVQEARAAADAIMAQFKGDTSQQGQQDQQAAPEPKDTDVQQDTAQDAPPTPPNDSEETWRQRCNTITGKYNAEVPRLSEQIRELKEEVKARDARIAELEAARQAPQAQPPTDVNRDALAEYDEEFGKMYDLNMAQRAKIEELQAALDQLQGNVRQVHQTQQQAEDKAFARDLLNAVPDFDQLNGSEELGLSPDREFVEWLDGIDSFSKRPRREIGDDLMGKRNVADIKNFFDTFRASRKKQPQPRPQTHTEPNTAPTNVDVTQYAQQQGGEIYTTQEVDEMYRLRRIGNYPFKWRGMIFKSYEETRPVCDELIRAGHELRIR